MKFIEKVQKKHLKAILVFLSIGLAIIHYTPVRTFFIRSVIVFGWLALLLCLTLLIFGLKSKKPWIFILALFALFFLVPQNSQKLPHLKTKYTNTLESYRDIKYVWGGENRTGIDCSGLLRISLSDCLLNESFKRLNPLLLKQAFLLWFFDSSAKALLEGHRTRTVKILTADPIKAIEHSKIQTGDIAITQNGGHALAYIGDQRWIQADPLAHKVIVCKKNSENPWLTVPIVILRWSVFVDKNKF